MTEAVYFDASALVKLVVTEDESGALAEFISSIDQAAITSIVSEIEVKLAVRRGGGQVELAQASQVLSSLERIMIDQEIVDAASKLTDVRTLDAIHLASAQALGSDLRYLVTYDRRLLAAAGSIGIDAVSPS